MKREMVQKVITMAMEFISTVVLVKQASDLLSGEYIGTKILIVPAIIGVGIVTKELNKMIITDKIIRVIKQTEAIYNIKIKEEDALEVLKLSRRKCEMNGKGVSYLPIMFADDLKNSLVMRAINSYSNNYQ